MNANLNSTSPTLDQIKLSPRELELLTLLNKGCRVREAACMMEIKETTARTMVRRTYRKLGANNLQTALYEAREIIFI